MPRSYHREVWKSMNLRGGQGADAQSLSINRNNIGDQVPTTRENSQQWTESVIANVMLQLAWIQKAGETVMIRSVHYSKWVWCTVPRSPLFHLYYCSFMHSTKWQIHLDCSQTGRLPDIKERPQSSKSHWKAKEINGCLLALYFAEDLF